MAELKLNRVGLGDNQITLVDKINGNFSSLSEFLGGPSGINGNQGKYGIEGDPGLIGPKGLRGPRGSIWIFGNEEPEAGSYFPGDYWIDISDGNSVYSLSNDSLWEFQNFKLASSDYFRRISNITGFTDKDVIVQSDPNPETNTFVLNSIEPDVSKLNPQYSRFLIETNPGATSPYSLLDQPIIEFDKIESGGTANSEKTPIITWDKTNINNPALGKGISWDIRQGGFAMNFGDNIDIRNGYGFIKFISYDSGLFLNSGNISLNSTGSITIGDSSVVKGSISISTPSLSMGLGTMMDLSTFSGRFVIEKSLVGNSLPALEISNSSSNSGSSFIANIDSDGPGMYWKNTIYYEDLIKITKNLSSSDFKVARQMGISKKPTGLTSATHGSFGGSTIKWLGIFPNGDGGVITEKISWYGDENITIDAASASSADGLYLNTYHLMDYMPENSSITITCDFRGDEIRAIGIGNYTTGQAYPDNSVASQWKGFSSVDVYSVDMHIVKDTGATGGGGYNVYYEAFGSTGGIESGVLY